MEIEEEIEDFDLVDVPSYDKNEELKWK